MWQLCTYTDNQVLIAINEAALKKACEIISRNGCKVGLFINKTCLPNVNDK